MIRHSKRSISVRTVALLATAALVAAACGGDSGVDPEPLDVAGSWGGAFPCPTGSLVSVSPMLVTLTTAPGAKNSLAVSGSGTLGSCSDATRTDPILVGGAVTTAGTSSIVTLDFTNAAGASEPFHEATTFTSSTLTTSGMDGVVERQVTGKITPVPFTLTRR